MLNSNLLDTGWLNIAGDNGNFVIYRKKSGIVYISRGAIKKLPANTWTDIVTLPEGYIPLYAVTYNITAESGNSVVRVQTDGRIQYYSSLANYIPPHIVSFPVS